MSLKIILLILFELKVCHKRMRKDTPKFLV